VADCGTSAAAGDAGDWVSRHQIAPTQWRINCAHFEGLKDTGYDALCPIDCRWSDAVRRGANVRAYHRAGKYQHALVCRGKMPVDSARWSVSNRWLRSGRNEPCPDLGGGLRRAGAAIRPAGRSWTRLSRSWRAGRGGTPPVRPWRVRYSCRRIKAAGLQSPAPSLGPSPSAANRILHNGTKDRRRLRLALKTFGIDHPHAVFPRIGQSRLRTVGLRPMPTSDRVLHHPREWRMSQPAVASSAPPPILRRAFHWWLAQVRHALPPTIFFFVGFNLILLTKRLILEEHDIEFGGFLTATLASSVGRESGPGNR
jgi:hypothetical protein